MAAMIHFECIIGKGCGCILVKGREGNMRRQTRTRLLSRAACLAAIGLLALTVGGLALGRPASATPGQATSASSQTNLTWSTWGSSAANNRVWNKVAAMVTKNYPNIHITVQMSSFADYFTKLAIESASNSMPCIVSIQGQRVPGFGQDLKSLNPLISGSKFQLGVFDPTILKDFVVNGKQLALPYDFGPEVIYYNKTLFKKFGLPLPTNTWTMAQFLKDAKAMTTSTTYGYTTYPWDDPFVWSVDLAGQNVYLQNGKLNLTSPAFVKAFTTYTDFVHSQHLAPVIPSTTDADWDIDSQWQLGSVGMVVDGPWDMSWDESTAKFQFGIAPMPAGPAGSLTVEAGSGYEISKNCNDDSAAWDAIQVMTGAAVGKYLGQIGQNFSARSAEQQYWLKSAVPGSASTIEYALAHAIPYETTANWDQVQHVMAQYAVTALNGTSSPKSVLDEITSQVG